MAENANLTTTRKETPAANDDQQDTTMSEAKASSIKRIMLPLTIISFLLSFPILFCIVWLLYQRCCVLEITILDVGIDRGHGATHCDPHNRIGTHRSIHNREQVDPGFTSVAQYDGE
ncbi:hypothetical protein L2E82_03438 [Cichorium intybus]|uniref:Uncharacterized protein n=1 Tax=Cichorium intybus TaxID=13427 RepID=A0ACB9H3J1_CICIN|nr:hypothetical protein L2E82_03438 [Cichorium intybus]